MAASESLAGEGFGGLEPLGAKAVGAVPQVSGWRCRSRHRMSAHAARFQTEYKTGHAGRKPDTGIRETSFQAPHYWIPGEVLRQRL